MLGLEKIFDTDKIRKGYTRVNVYDARKEIGYQAKRNGFSLAIRKLADFGAQAVESSAEAIGLFISGTVGTVLQFILGREIAANLGLFAGSIGGSLAGIAGLGIAGGISAGFAEMDYLHQKRNLRDLYAEEMGAKLGKDPKSVTVADMEELAKKNPILDEEIKRCKKQRNFAVPLAVVATLASFAMAVYALPLALTALSLPALGEMSLLGSIALKTGVSMLTYVAVKNPLQAIANKQFGLLDETANDRLVDIQYARHNGITITPEDLMPVMVKANPKLDDQIVSQFGGHFEELTPDKRALALNWVKSQVPLEVLAHNINSGVIKSTELLFASVGERSGVPPQIPSEDKVELTNALPQQMNVSFTDKHASAKHAANASFVERLSQSSAEASASVSGSLA